MGGGGEDGARNCENSRLFGVLDFLHVMRLSGAALELVEVFEAGMTRRCNKVGRKISDSWKGRIQHGPGIGIG
jgi:hypothetical protein